jgi:hypothetical protein
MVPNSDADDRLWKVHGKRQAIYGRADVPAGERMKAAWQLCSSSTSYAPRF